jgi:hypothetical protein
MASLSVRGALAMMVMVVAMMIGINASASPEQKAVDARIDALQEKIAKAHAALGAKSKAKTHAQKVDKEEDDDDDVSSVAAMDDDYSSCFTGNTLVRLADGTAKAIKDVRINDVLQLGGKVVATMQFEMPSSIHTYKGVRVTGDHAVKANGAWLRVADAPGAVASSPTVEEGDIIFDLITKGHRIVVSPHGGEPAEDMIFADYEETTDTEAETAGFLVKLAEQDAVPPAA